MFPFYVSICVLVLLCGLNTLVLHPLVLPALCDRLCFYFLPDSIYSVLVYWLLIGLLFFMGNCRYVGNIHPQVTDPLLQEVFSNTGPIEGCKLIRKDKVRLKFPA